jgi:hypothetical protein
LRIVPRGHSSRRLGALLSKMVKVERVLIITTSQSKLGESEEMTGVW